MIRSFTALCTALLLASMLYAQSAPVPPPVYPAELTRGTSYTGFHWTPGVGDFSGRIAGWVPTYTGGEYGQMSLYGVTYGYFISTGWSVEGVLDFGSTSSEQDLANGTGTNKTSETEFAITAMGKYYFLPKFEDVAVWIGAGITFGSLSTTDETTGTNPAKTEYSGTAVGFGLDFGAQYFIARGFALSADYMLGFISYSKPEVTTTSGNVSTTVKGPDSSMFGTMSGSLGILFYF